MSIVRQLSFKRSHNMKMIEANVECMSEVVPRDDVNNPTTKNFKSKIP